MAVIKCSNIALAIYNLFTDFQKVTCNDIIVSCDMYTEYYADEKVSAMYDQDLLWTCKTFEHSIASTALLNEVRIKLELLNVKDCTGPMTLKILMDKQVHHTQAMCSTIKQHWLYHMCITNYTGENVTQFTADWRHLESYFLSLGNNISNSCHQYFKALTD